MNSSEHAPESIMLPVSDDTNFSVGEICCINEVGYLTQILTPGVPRYLVQEEKVMSDHKAALKCMRIFEGMIFEGDLTDDYFERLVNGQTLELGSDVNSHKLFVSNVYGKDLEVISTMNFPYERKIAVTFF